MPGTSAEGAGAGVRPGAEADGDYELARPAGSLTGGAVAADAATGEQAGSRQPGTASTAADGGQGDFELARPAERAEPADRPESAERPQLGGQSQPAERLQPADRPESAERPQPLHDPDPYSTPPYGEPGPWAPAPPVQHPAVTSAHGGAAPARSAAPGAALPPAPPEQPVPLPGAPSAPVHTAPDQLAAPAPTPPPAPHTDLTTHPDTAPANPNAHPPSHPTANLHPAPDTAPANPNAQPPSHPTPNLHPAPDTAPANPNAHPTPTPTPGTTPPPSDPWQRYDPWAVEPLPAAPLQHSGAAVLTPEQRRGRVRRRLVGAAVALALVSGMLGGLAGAYIERNGGVGAVELPQAGKEPAGRAPDSVAGIAARALPSVVTLHVSGSEEQGTGTGFVLDGLGHILTNNHVVEPAADGGDISVTFSGGQTARARIIGRDSGYDLAVVQVRGVRGLTPMPLGNSDNVRVGDPVVAIGAPFDLANTVTSGIISAKERPITAGGEKGDGSDMSYVDALQTDAPINPGNSGGPLLDSRARVVGINSAIRSADNGSDLQTGQAGSIGLGFAIPINQAKRVAEELINTGRATHPVIGVTLDMNWTGDGARVGAKSRDGGPAVTPGGPGARAGIRPGDVITEVDGRPVHSGEELIVKTRAHRPGDHLELTVEHDGKERKVSLVLGSAHSG
ncbi:trypsin-like peptidase domain-containing protein [Streptomyces sp. NPDC096152]|uniref:S1C family serine protease n=1 Tax=Streptomyces sp. NPDC096152 TaxID=3366078 RepID=UPI003819BD02